MAEEQRRNRDKTMDILEEMKKAPKPEEEPGEQSDSGNQKTTRSE